MPPSRELTARSWLIILPEDAALFGVTAAEWYDLPVKPDPGCHVIVPAGGVVPRRRPGLIPHEGLGDDDWLLHEGLRTTNPERTFLDLAPRIRRIELVIVGDAMVRRGLTTVESLRGSAAEAHRRRGSYWLARPRAWYVLGSTPLPKRSCD